LVGEVERFEEISGQRSERRGTDESQSQRLAGTHLPARIDHINGVVFTQRATKVWKPETQERKKIKSVIDVR